MRKLAYTLAAFFIVSAVGWATPCPNGSFNGFQNSTSTSACDISGNAYGNISTTLSNSLSGKVNITPITSGADSGGFSASIPLSDVAGLTTGNTFAFTVTAPSGNTITDLMAVFDLETGATGTGNVLFTGNNGSSLTANLNGGQASATFAGVAALGLTGTIRVASGATGTGTLMIVPSLTASSTTPPSSTAPEPASLALFGTGLLLGAAILLRRKRRSAERISS